MGSSLTDDHVSITCSNKLTFLIIFHKLLFYFNDTKHNNGIRRTLKKLISSKVAMLRNRHYASKLAMLRNRRYASMVAMLKVWGLFDI